jgi:hypothetical protein
VYTRKQRHRVASVQEDTEQIFEQCEPLQHRHGHRSVAVRLLV